MTGLTTTQQRRLKHLEDEIRDCGNKITANLDIIDDEKLYIGEYKTFAEYCLAVWKMTQQHVLRLKKHENVLRLFDGKDVDTCAKSEPIGSLLKESHTREVADLPDEEKVEVLEAAIVTAPKKPDGTPKVTAKHVAETKAKAKEPKTSIVLDDLKRAVPEHLAEHHEAAAAISAAATRFDAITKLIRDLSETPGGAFIACSEMLSDISKIKKRLKDSRYCTECPACAGELPASSCKRCKGAGFIPHSMKGVLSADEKEWLGA